MQRCDFNKAMHIYQLVNIRKIGYIGESRFYYKDKIKIFIRGTHYMFLENTGFFIVYPLQSVYPKKDHSMFLKQCVEHLSEF